MIPKVDHENKNRRWCFRERTSFADITDVKSLKVACWTLAISCWDLGSGLLAEAGRESRNQHTPRRYTNSSNIEWRWMESINRSEFPAFRIEHQLWTQSVSPSLSFTRDGMGGNVELWSTAGHWNLYVVHEGPFRLSYCVNPPMMKLWRLGGQSWSRQLTGPCTAPLWTCHLEESNLWFPYLPYLDARCKDPDITVRIELPDFAKLTELFSPLAFHSLYKAGWHWVTLKFWGRSSSPNACCFEGPRCGEWPNEKDRFVCDLSRYC